uniref:U1 small nuclear ribonucleoprotein of 70kDa N-terminal domain-containing protein n=1 Tax=Timema genevievae TaxID=629358 RepID=A0A7R9PKN8_TIMGE|nr:unnamed protein product [Timema genevievae]
MSDGASRRGRDERLGLKKEGVMSDIAWGKEGVEMADTNRRVDAVSRPQTNNITRHSTSRLKWLRSIWKLEFFNTRIAADPKDTPPPTRVETREERLERRRRERAEQVAYKLEQEIAVWDPHSLPLATADPFKTLFVARIKIKEDSPRRRGSESHAQYSMATSSFVE